MSYRIIVLGIILVALVNTMHCQYLEQKKDAGRIALLTGNLHNDFILQTTPIDGSISADSIRPAVRGKKYSPMVAGLLSAVVPGAGQFYTKNYWQSAAFFGAEVLAWVVYASYERQGDQRTNDFKQFANAHWSVVRYANWINSPVGFQNYYRAGIIIGTPPANVPDPWNYVNWTVLNQCEDDIGAQVGSGFTHKLAPYGDQQYYEMIGKYSQFGGGWDDAATFQSGGYTRADIVANNGIGNVSPRFIAYSHMRGDANSSYNIGTTISYIIVANHIFSALEAAFNASKIDHRVQLQGHIESRNVPGNLVEFVPTLEVKYGL